MKPPKQAGSEFEDHAREQRPGLVREFLEFLGHNKKWWLLPLVALLLVMALIMILGGTAAAPFIYTLF